MSDDLDALWGGVAHIARDRVSTISAAAQATRDGRPDALELRRVAFDECHKLVGSLGSYGRCDGSGLALEAAGLLAAMEPDVDALDDVVRRLGLAID